MAIIHRLFSLSISIVDKYSVSQKNFLGSPYNFFISQLVFVELCNEYFTIVQQGKMQILLILVIHAEDKERIMTCRIQTGHVRNESQ